MKLEELKSKIDLVLNKLYKNEIYLFEHNLCERCINYKFALYLEELFSKYYFVDSEYNRAYSKRNGGVGTKKITTQYGNYVDIVITKRDDNPDHDFVCFEIKKWNNEGGEIAIEEDRNKLRILTGNKLPTDKESNQLLKNDDGDYYCFNYKFGVLIIYAQTREDVIVEIIENKNNRNILTK
jgi:hypothetical protein